MRHINQEHVTDALRELADEVDQRRLWLASHTEVSSFTEAVCHLFDDSGLGDAINGNDEVYGWAVDGRLRLLSEAIDRVPQQLAVPDLIADPTMLTVRAIAAALLRDLNNLRYSNED